MDFWDEVLTVGKLIEHLKTFDPALEIVIESQGAEYQRLVRINPPCGDADIERDVCLVAGGPYL